MNVYRSYALSHFVYSAPVLTSTNKNSKEQMIKFQARSLKMIGITPEIAKQKYKVNSIEELLDTTCINILTNILTKSTHAVTAKLTTNIRSDTLNNRYRTSKARTEHYNNSFLQKYLRHLRDGTANLYKHPQLDSYNRRITKTVTAQKVTYKTPTITQKTNCPYCSQPFKVLKTHLRLNKTCNSRQQNDTSKQ